uniref:Putative secreted protein n=1 Tax=Amblyomma americanum TaxID=6943 RepID=A0A0C9SEH0_AMBAM
MKAFLAITVLSAASLAYAAPRRVKADSNAATGLLGSGTSAGSDGPAGSFGSTATGVLDGAFLGGLSTGGIAGSGVRGGAFPGLTSGPSGASGSFPGSSGSGSSSSGSGHFSAGFGLGEVGPSFSDARGGAFGSAGNPGTSGFTFRGPLRGFRIGALPGESGHRGRFSNGGYRWSSAGGPGFYGQHGYYSPEFLGNSFGFGYNPGYDGLNSAANPYYGSQGGFYAYGGPGSSFGYGAYSPFGNSGEYGLDFPSGGGSFSASGPSVYQQPRSRSAPAPLGSAASGSSASSSGAVSSASSATPSQ